MFDKPNGAGALLTVFDTFTPTVGYSFRYLSIGYFGQPVVEVRKDVVDNPTQDFTPSQLTDGTLEAFADGNDCYVSTWYDQFGSNDATQASASAQPKIWNASTGLVMENDRPALDFDGSDDFLSDTFTIPISNGFTIVSVVKENSLPGNNGAYNIGTDATNGISKFYNSSANYTPFVIAIQSNSDKFRPIGSISRNTNQNLILDIFDGVDKTSASSVSFSINGSLTASVDAGVINTITSNQFRIGRAGATFSGDHFDGKYQEFIVYASDQSANREAIEDNINDYYDIY